MVLNVRKPEIKSLGGLDLAFSEGRLPRWGLKDDETGRIGKKIWMFKSAQYLSSKPFLKGANLTLEGSKRPCNLIHWQHCLCTSGKKGPLLLTLCTLQGTLSQYQLSSPQKTASGISDPYAEREFGFSSSLSYLGCVNQQTHNSHPVSHRVPDWIWNAVIAPRKEYL